MKITAEVTIDLDEKRRVWAETAAEGDIADLDEIATKLATAAAQGALSAHEKAAERHGLPIKRPDPLETFSGRNDQ